MGEEVTLYLETTEHHFARWLRDQISRSLPSPYQAQDGARIYLERPRPPYLDGFASRIDVASTGTSRAGSVPMGLAISFRYMEYKPGATTVVARCHLPEAVDYFEALLAAMQERWPEARAWAPISTHTGAGEEPAPEISARRSLYPHVRERESVIERLWHEGSMIWQIAQQANCSESTVNRCLKKLGLSRRRKN